MRVRTKHSPLEAKEQKSSSRDYAQRFQRALKEQRYDAAVKIASQMPDCLVCYYSSYHLDFLIASGKVQSAKRVARSLGRNLDTYLSSVPGMNSRDKTYKAGRRD